MKYCPGKNFIVKFNEILFMDDISYEILSHGHYFIEDNILWYTCIIIKHLSDLDFHPKRLKKLTSVVLINIIRSLLFTSYLFKSKVISCTQRNLKFNQRLTWAFIAHMVRNTIANIRIKIKSFGCSVTFGPLWSI